MIDEQKRQKLTAWLGTGSINIFGLPFAGKDTVGQKLADLLGGEVVSSGDLLRLAGETVQESGALSPKNEFLRVVLPELANPRFAGQPLILSSVGRWHGEEKPVVKALASADHPLKAVVYLKISVDEVIRRKNAAEKSGERGRRADDQAGKLPLRMDEFNNKTLPVIEFYKQQGFLIEVDGVGSQVEVLTRVLAALVEFAK